MNVRPPQPNLSPQPDWAECMEQVVLDAALARAGQLGWNARLLREAGASAGLGRGDLELLFPNGARDLAALLSRRHDARALQSLSELDADSLKIRERISRSVLARLEAAGEDLDASRRCAGFLALPGNADLGLSLAWETADQLWCWSGDKATDWNHYSKRTILVGILIPGLTLRLFDGRQASDAFVADRIANVMAFETWKAGKDFEGPLKRFTAALAGLRYRA